ncbi:MULTISPECIES: ATP-grasp domain-containing protein [Pseudomonas]|uniref:Carboxylate--amine ligase n=1 Tax=Pseudomonas neustonica TaxID=2487346 RepID=A0ABX9XF84_9PSED|nr:MULTISPECIES: ATP-grasp domain-containing protein [Pseudomonas]MAB25224.1 carboxylate--amine ligase [Pseudomonadales bacterium]MBF22635.1 carboxylate--amine ligase [Pusillimonas sp.]MBA6419577.1 ATP-grasp domain-containing protein [Pseudomonas sp. 5Ae-yellow]ROZ82492.1 carboxylate--amine ligase [Pseudomonas neustonica]ROZ82563.1 carboxylate--amine ligase [Pseudomonas sp. SSM44]|tara:strand:+ start:755 stop:1759 length:1005 start_codon:yes stop_codon:yes gene_type:complete
MLLVLEGHSSQRDVIAGARDALPPSVQIFASHREQRPEITGLADVAWTEPSDNTVRVDWVIDKALSNSIEVVLAGKFGQLYEAHRGRFEANGIRLVTGCISLEGLQIVEDKGRFTAAALAGGLNCIPGVPVTSSEQLVAVYHDLVLQGPVCVKPVAGVYGQGFWRLSENTDPFRCFANASACEANLRVFADTYAQAKTPTPLLLMPYLSGSECSIDMVCEAGDVIAYVGRRKQGYYQTFEREGRAVDLAIRAATHFKCDGLVNVQTRDDGEGIPHLLEINPRYSGGIGYTREVGVNLPGIFASRRLSLPEPISQWKMGVRVKPINVAISLDGRC